METTRFVDDANFLRSSMNLGNRDMDDHLRELLDNSIDAGATRIWIVLDARNPEMARLVVGDDGCGIPKEFEYRGKTYEGVPFVMAFGSGRNTHADETSTIGRFGFGLSTAIVSQARDQGVGRVYTKQETDEDWRWSEYHFDRVVANKCRLPPEQLGGLDFLPPWDTGTFVVIDLADSAGMRPGAHQSRILAWVGRVYREMIAQGLTITVIGRTGTKDDTKVATLRDPLALMPESKEAKELGAVKEYEVPDLVLDDEESPLGAVLDPNTGLPARIQFRLSLIDNASSRRKLGLPTVGAQGFFEKEKTLKKYNIGHDGQGFSVLREGRELAHARSLGIYTKHPEYKWMHGSIDFPSALDDLMNVQVNKNQFEVDPRLREVLKSHLAPHLHNLRRDVTAAGRLAAEVAKVEMDIEPLAERLAKELLPVLPQARLSAEDRKRGQEAREQMLKQQMAQASTLLDKTADDVLNQAVDTAMAKESRSGEVVDRAAAAAFSLLDERRAEWMSRIQRRWNTQSPARILVPQVGEADAYAGPHILKVVDRGDEAHIHLSTSTAFYTDVYAEVKDDETLRTMLDIMQCSVGYAQYIDGKIEDRKQNMYWERVLTDVSLHSQEFVTAMPIAKDEEVSE